MEMPQMNILLNYDLLDSIKTAFIRDIHLKTKII